MRELRKLREMAEGGSKRKCAGIDRRRKRRSLGERGWNKEELGVWEFGGVGFVFGGESVRRKTKENAY